MTLASSTYSAYAKVLTSALSPLSLVFLSEILTLALIVTWYGASAIVQEIVHVRRRHIVPLFLVGFLSSVLAPVFLFVGLHSTSAINAALFSNSEVVFLILLAVLILGEVCTRWHVVASLLICIGIATIVLGDSTGNVQLHVGDLLLLSAGLVWAGSSVIFRLKLTDIPTHLVITMRALTAIASFFVLSAFVRHPFIEQVRLFPLSLIPSLFGFVVIARIVNLSGFYIALDRLSASTVSLVGSLSIIGSVIFTAFYLNEPVLPVHYIGGALIIGGTIVLELLGTHKSPKHLEAHLRQRMHHRV